MSTQPNNDTLHAQNLARGNLTGGMQARITEKGTKRTLNGLVPYRVNVTLARPEPRARKNLTLEGCTH
jgi:hypothetical protein